LLLSSPSPIQFVNVVMFPGVTSWYGMPENPIEWNDVSAKGDPVPSSASVKAVAADLTAPVAANPPVPLLIDCDSSSTSATLSPHPSVKVGLSTAACADRFLDADRAVAKAATPADMAITAATPQTSRAIRQE
jgi:hypothetical protein